MDEGFIMDPKIMIQIVSIAVAMGGAWALVKSSLKTAQRDLEDLAGRLKELGTDLHKRVDIIEQDKRELMEWLLAKPSHEQTDILAMRSIRKSCNFVG